MSSMEKVVIYPYDIQSAPLLRHADLLAGYRVVDVVSPKGWGMVGKDAGCADGGDRIGFIVKEQFPDSPAQWDSVLFMEPAVPMDFERVIKPRIDEAMDAGKNIIWALKPENGRFAETAGKCRRKGVSIKNFNNLTGMDKLKADVEFEILHDIKVPVIFVLGMADRTSKFEIQLVLRERLSAMGYKISQVGSRSCCEILGFHSFPAFMHSTDLPESNKIVLFNHYIKQIELTEEPDVIIIGIPGGIMPFNNILTNKFGIFAYEVSQAVKPDAVVFSTMYRDTVPDYFDNISTTVRYKFGFDIDCYNMANTFLDLSESERNRAMSYVTLDSSLVDVKLDRSPLPPIPIYNILNSHDSLRMPQYLISLLSG